jgi:hypothetical protein
MSAFPLRASSSLSIPLLHLFGAEDIANKLKSMMSFKEIVQVYIDFLSGKKAYIVGGLMIVLGLMQGNNDIVLQGLGVITLRMGINKSNPLK